MKLWLVWYSLYSPSLPRFHDSLPASASQAGDYGHILNKQLKKMPTLGLNLPSQQSSKF